MTNSFYIIVLYKVKNSKEGKILIIYFYTTDKQEIIPIKNK